MKIVDRWIHIHTQSEDEMFHFSRFSRSSIKETFVSTTLSLAKATEVEAGNFMTSCWLSTSLISFHLLFPPMTSVTRREPFSELLKKQVAFRFLCTAGMTTGFPLVLHIVPSARPSHSEYFLL